MMVSGWTVRETNQKRALFADFLDIHAEYFLEKMKWAFMLSHFLSCFVGFLGRRSPAENSTKN